MVGLVAVLVVLGLALPGNGTIVATHADRKRLFLEAGRKIVEITRAHYETEDLSLLPRAIARGSIAWPVLPEPRSRRRQIRCIRVAAPL